MDQKSSGITPKLEYVLVLPDIRSVINVGAIFRTADAVGITRIILTGYTPTPVDRFGRIRTDFAKAALGAEHAVPWEYSESGVEAIKKLKKEGFVIVGIEQAERSIDYKQVEKTGKMAIVMGTETTGMTQEMLGLCDVIAEIPMRGGKESLNVSVAAGVALYRILDR